MEDKIVQGAVREVLGAVYEQDFLECSYGFRPGRGAHDAIRALNCAVYQGKVSWILEADIESFFDSLDRTRLEEMLRIRVADGSLRRLVGKCVRVGVLDGEERTEPERGTPQGSGLSPLLGNLYLHHTLDVWFEREVKPRLGGEAVLVRYCDDFVIGFERREGRAAGSGGAGQADGAVRTEAASGEDSAHCVRAPRGGTAQWEGAGHVRFSGVHDVLATDAARTLADVVQDAEQGPEAIQSNGLRMVSAPPASTGRGPARSAQETLGRTLQLLRSERQPSKFGPSGSRHANGSGANGCAVAASARVSRGSGSTDCWNASRFPARGLSCGYGGRSHEAHQRRSRMVEISLSGSGEGLG